MSSLDVDEAHLQSLLPDAPFQSHTHTHEKLQDFVRGHTAEQ